MSTWWWELISLSRHSHVPAIQPDLPKADSASSLSPRLTSSDLLKKVILSSTLFALSIYQVEKFDVPNIIEFEIEVDIFNATLQI